MRYGGGDKSDAAIRRSGAGDCDLFYFLLFSRLIVRPVYKYIISSESYSPHSQGDSGSTVVRRRRESQREKELSFGPRVSKLKL